MYIALLTDGIFPYVIGGMQKHSYYLAKFLAQNEVFIDLFHFNQSDLDIDKLSCFNEQEKKYITSYVLNFPVLNNLPGHYIKESYAYSEIIFDIIKPKLSTYDFIYAKGFAGWKLIEEKKKGFACPPVGVKFHGLNMFQPAYSLKNKLESILLQPAAKYNLSNADYVFSYGGKITDLTKKIGIPVSKIIEIPTGIDETWIEFTFTEVDKNHKRSFVFIGRYDKIKGIKELNNAIIKLVERNVSFDFHFVGPFPEEKKLNYGNVFYHGKITEVKSLQSILKQCDVLVCPSYSEGMPNVIIEAMAMGLAIIATDVGAINVLVSSSNGWLLSKPTQAEIINNLMLAINIDDGELHQMKKKSVEKVISTLQWQTIIKQLIMHISEIINTKNR